jgi:hypothetical protein
MHQIIQEYLLDKVNQRAVTLARATFNRFNGIVDKLQLAG